MTPSPLAGRHAMSGTFASIDARLEPRSFALTEAAATADAQAILRGHTDAEMRETVRRVIDARAADQAAIEANRREERIAGFDSSPWGVS